jgi:hypothetical protein
VDYKNIEVMTRGEYKVNRASYHILILVSNLERNQGFVSSRAFNVETGRLCKGLISPKDEAKRGHFPTQQNFSYD